MENVFETLGNLMAKEPLNEGFKMSVLDCLKVAGFEQSGTENGTPVYEMKPEPICECCGLPERFCDEHDELFV